jgi:hypothetical protein
MEIGKEYAQIEYRGVGEVTHWCLVSLCEVLQADEKLSKAIIVSLKDKNGCGSHCIMLLKAGEPKYIIRNGFSSGYTGEGPSGLSKAIILMREFDLEVVEVEVSKSLFKKVSGSGLINNEVDQIMNMRFSRFFAVADYITDIHDDLQETNIWKSIPIQMPFTIIDGRLLDIAKSFWNDPDAALTKAYRRLEDIVRDRAGVEGHGTKLFSQVFSGESPILSWKIGKQESKGFVQLFIGAYMGFRNNRAHREEKDFNEQDLMIEFMVLNSLYNLESKAKVVSESSRDKEIRVT